MTREVYDECHGTDIVLPQADEPVCSVCGRDLFDEERVFEANDTDGHSVICMDCLKKMSIGELAELFGAELVKVRNL